MKKTFWDLAISEDSVTFEDILGEIGSGEDVNIRNNNGEIPLMFAIRRNKIKIASVLIEKGANVAHINKDGTTPLSTAISQKNARIIRILLSGGAKATVEQEVEIQKIIENESRKVVVKILDRGPHNVATISFGHSSKKNIPSPKDTETENKSKISWQAKYDLSAEEIKQVEEYIEIYKSNNFTQHHEVNKYITDRNLWNNFSKIRALNDHGRNKEIQGILPKYYGVVCVILGIKGGNGQPLDKSVPY